MGTWDPKPIGMTVKWSLEDQYKWLDLTTMADSMTKEIDKNILASIQGMPLQLRLFNDSFYG